MRLVLCSMNVSNPVWGLLLCPFRILGKAQIVSSRPRFGVISAASVAIIHDIGRFRACRSTPANVCWTARIFYAYVGCQTCLKIFYFQILFWNCNKYIRISMFKKNINTKVLSKVLNNIYPLVDFAEQSSVQSVFQKWKSVPYGSVPRRPVYEERWIHIQICLLYSTMVPDSLYMKWKQEVIKLNSLKLTSWIVSATSPVSNSDEDEFPRLFK